MPSVRRISAGLVPLILLACATEPKVSDNVALNYSIWSVNGDSPDAKTIFGSGGYKISIPRGSLLLRIDGTVEEVLQYTITRPSNTDPISATDTVYGHYERVSDHYEVRLPGANGTESYSGAVNLGTDFVELARSWKKDGVTVLVNIVYARSSL